MRRAKIIVVMCQMLALGFAYASDIPVPNPTDLQDSLPGRVLAVPPPYQQARVAHQTTSFDYSATAVSHQIPLCMIGDSITWAGEGDCWRKELLSRMPNLAFIGTHSAAAGFSHAGEGGNNTDQVLKRIEYLPDCPYYSLLIGTNNNNVSDVKKVKAKAEKTAQSIVLIVHALLKRNSVKKIFLSSLLPCHTDNPLRDQCNRETNKRLRADFDRAFPSGKVVWVEYEKPLRERKGWEEKIRLHPTPAGYQWIADITAKSISSALNIKQGESFVRPANCGIRVVNLMEDDRTTSCPVIAGWYTLSFKVTDVSGENTEVRLQGADSGKRFPFQLTIPIEVGQKVVTKTFFTQYERYKYSRDFMNLTAIDCEISEVLLEKARPSMKPSVYGKGTYVDTVSTASLGELWEYEE